MPEILVIEWDRDQLIAATGSASGSTVRLNSAVVVDRMREKFLPSELGAELAQALSRSGITATEAITVFPRELVTFHRIELPNIGDKEIAGIVRLQAATRLTVPIDSVCLDFVPLPVKPGAETREVLLVTAPRKHINEVREALTVCNIELVGVRVSSFGIAASVVHSGLLSDIADPQAVEAIVSLGTDSIEMIFMTGQHVAFSHSGASWTSLEGVEQAVRAEISRARLAAAEDMGNYVVRRLILIGSPEITAAVPDSISRRLNDAEVVRIDPEGTLLSCALPEGLTAPDMLAIGGVVANRQTTAVETVDLINPRKPAEQKDYRRLQTIAAIGAAVLLLVSAWKWRSDRVGAVEKEVARYQTEIGDMQSTYKAAKNELLLAERLTEWSDRDINWLEEGRKIKELMQTTERVYVKEFLCKAGNARNAGTISIVGYAKSRRDIEDLARVLTEAGYEVAPHTINQSLRDADYAMELNLEVSIPIPQEQPVAKTTT